MLLGCSEIYFVHESSAKRSAELLQRASAEHDCMDTLSDDDPPVNSDGDGQHWQVMTLKTREDAEETHGLS